MAEYVNSSKEFHLAMIASPDEEMSVDWDGNTGFQTAEAAMEHTKQMVDENGGEYIIFRCVPYKRVRRGNTQVLKFGPR